MPAADSATPASIPAPAPPQTPAAPSFAQRHLQFGWWALAVGLSLGIALEILNGFKVGWYLDVGNETRRTMLMLAHTHGTLLALVNLAAGLTWRTPAAATAPSQHTPSPATAPTPAQPAPTPAEPPRWASRALRVGGILLPGGFFLGAFGVYGGDPGVGIFLVPVGAAALLAAVVRLACLLGK